MLRSRRTRTALVTAALALAPMVAVPLGIASEASAGSSALPTVFSSSTVTPGDTTTATVTTETVGKVDDPRSKAAQQ